MSEINIMINFIAYSTNSTRITIDISIAHPQFATALITP